MICEIVQFFGLKIVFVENVIVYEPVLVFSWRICMNFCQTVLAILNQCADLKWQCSNYQAEFYGSLSWIHYIRTFLICGFYALVSAIIYKINIERPSFIEYLWLQFHALRPHENLSIGKIAYATQLPQCERKMSCKV